MTYYMLFIREDGQWAPEFGDSDKEAVEYERDSYVEGYQQVKRRDTKIEKFPRTPSNTAVAIRAQQLNDRS